jgi:TolB-like protein/DNA-binding winged helix-turn-helix (wHTH) protein
VPSHVPGAVYQFGDFQLDCGRFELFRNGHSLRVERKPMELLILLASRQSQLVTRAEIAQRLWSSEVFVDTEHGINTAIRKLRYLLRDDSEDPKFIQTVTGMGYRFIAPTVTIGEPAIDLPAAPTLEPAAADAVTAPQALTPAPQGFPKKPLAIQIAVVARFVGLTVLFIVMAIGPRKIAGLLHLDSDPPITSLAVIPLDNLSGDPNQEYLADGMTDDLITMLAKNSTLRIVSRTSVMQYKSARRPLREIANALGVDGVLEGSISRSGNRIHMTIQLIRAKTDAHIWAESYDRDADAIVSLPRDAALTIAERLKSAAVQPAPRYVNPEAHDAYIHGRYLWSAGQNDKAGEYFKKATELQPDYAPGWSGMSMYYVRGAATGEMLPLESLPLGEAAAIKAVQLDDSSPEAHMVMGGTVLVSRWDWARAERESIRTIELDPQYFEGYHLRARIFAALNRHEEALEAEKKAAELDPFARPSALSHYYVLARQYDTALQDALQRKEALPNDASLAFALFDIYRCKRMDQEAEQFFEKGLLLTGEKDSAEAVRHAFQKDGYRGMAAWQIEHLEKRSASHYVSPMDFAFWYAQLGQREKTLSLLEEGYHERSPKLLYIQSDPAYDFLHADPRYRSLIQRIGLPPAY